MSNAGSGSASGFGSGADGLSEAQGRWILFATVLASGMAFLDGTVLIVALPSIQAELGATLSGLQWVVDIYALFLAALLLTAGSLGDRLGRRRVFSYGIVVFTLGSLLCGLSADVWQLIAARGLQGIGAALMIPGSLAIIVASFPDERRGRAIGVWAGYAGGLATLGPALGGFLVQTLGWEYVFYLNIPFGLLALVVTARHVPESRDPVARRLDWPGTFLVTLALGGVAFGLIEGPGRGWTDPFVLTALITGSCATLAFLLVERWSSRPMLPLEIFLSPLVAAANLVTFFLYFALNGLFLFLALHLQQTLDFPPAIAGLAMLPSVLLITFLSGPAGALSDRTGPRRPMVIGPLLVAAGFVLIALSGRPEDYLILILPGLVLFGAGMALVIAPLTKSAMTVESARVGVASGVNNAVARIAALLAVAILGAVAVSLFTAQLGAEMDAQGMGSAQRSLVMAESEHLGGIDIPDALGAEARRMAEIAIDGAMLYSFRWIVGMCAALAALSSLLALLTIRASPGGSPPGLRADQD